MGTILTPQDQGAQRIGGDTIKRQAADTPFQSFKTDASMFDGGMGDALAEAGSNITEFGKTFSASILKKREDKSTIRKMEIEGSILDKMAEQGRMVTDRKLGNAEGVSADFNTDIETFYNDLDVETDLTEEDQARMALFKLKAKNNGYGAAYEHETEQREQNVLAKTEERIMSYSQAAQADPTNEGLYEDTVDAIVASEKKKGSVLQRDEDSTKLAIRNAVSAVNLGRINSALSMDTAAGNAYAEAIFEKGKKDGTIEGNHYDDIQDALSNANMSEEARRKTNVIMGAHSDEASALAAAESITDTDVYDETVKRIKDKFAVNERLRKRAEDKRFDDVSEMAADVGAVNTRIPEADLAGMLKREKDYIRTVEYERDMTAADPDWKRPGDGGKTWTKWHKDSSDLSKIENMSHATLVATYETKVTKKEFEGTILQEWRAIRVAAGKTVDKDADATGFGGLTALQAQKTAYFRSSGVKADDDSAGWVSFQGEYQRRTLAANNGKGTKEPSELDAILNDMVKAKIIYDEGNWGVNSDDEANAWVMTEDQKLSFGEDADLDNKQAFADNFNDILVAIQNSGKRITRENILKVWEANKGNF